MLNVIFEVAKQALNFGLARPVGNALGQPLFYRILMCKHDIATCHTINKFENRVARM